jgi:predicted PurR-regulated permease PerM
MVDHAAAPRRRHALAALPRSARASRAPPAELGGEGLILRYLERRNRTGAATFADRVTLVGWRLLDSDVSSGATDRFGHRVVQACLIGAAFILGGLLLWHAIALVLLIFAGILLAILLIGVSDPIARHLPVSRAALVVVIMLLIAAALIGGVALTGPELVAQGAQLRDSLAAEAVQRWAMSFDAVEESSLDLAQLLPSAEGALGGVITVIGATFGGLGYIVLIAFLGLYLAVNPAVYADAAIRLIPVDRRERMREVLLEAAETLRHWMLGTSAVMLLLGVITYVGLQLIGVPLALLLAVVSGLSAFVPIIGPMLAGALMVLVALSESWQLALWAGGFYLLLQTLESYLLTPLIQERAIDLPPAAVIAAQVLMGLLFGILGVVLATPLAAAASVMIKRLYVEGLLEGGR